MTRVEVLDVIGRYRNEAAVILGPGHASDELLLLAEAEPTLYKMDMAYAIPLCVGLALAEPSLKVVAVEGDGSALAALASLATVGRYRPPNLLIVVLDNESYGSIWDEHYPAIPSSSVTTDLAGVARDCSIGKVATVHTVEEADDALAAAFREPGPWFVVAKITERSDLRDRLAEHYIPDVFENSQQFARWFRIRKFR